MKAFVSNIKLVSAVCSTKIIDIMHDIFLHENRLLWIVNEEQNEGKNNKITRRYGSLSRSAIFPNAGFPTGFRIVKRMKQRTSGSRKNRYHVIYM